MKALCTAILLILVSWTAAAQDSKSGANASQTLAALFGITDPGNPNAPGHHKPPGQRVSLSVSLKTSDLPMNTATNSAMIFSNGGITSSPARDAIGCTIWARQPGSPGSKARKPVTFNSSQSSFDSQIPILENARVTAVCWNVLTPHLTDPPELEPHINLILIINNNGGITCTNIRPSTTVSDLGNAFGQQNLMLQTNDTAPVVWQSAAKSQLRKGTRDVPTEMAPTGEQAAPELPPMRMPDLHGQDSFSPSHIDENKK